MFSQAAAVGLVHFYAKTAGIHSGGHTISCGQVQPLADDASNGLTLLSGSTSDHKVLKPIVLTRFTRKRRKPIPATVPLMNATSVLAENSPPV
jgi:hypothetical protein